MGSPAQVKNVSREQQCAGKAGTEQQHLLLGQLVIKGTGGGALATTLNLAARRLLSSRFPAARPHPGLFWPSDPQRAPGNLLEMPSPTPPRLTESEGRRWVQQSGC